MKLSILIPVRAKLLYPFRYETPCSYLRVLNSLICVRGSLNCKLGNLNFEFLLIFYFTNNNEWKHILQQQQKSKFIVQSLFPLVLCLDKTFMQDGAIHMEVLIRRLGNKLHKKESILSKNQWNQQLKIFVQT